MRFKDLVLYARAKKGGGGSSGGSGGGTDTRMKELIEGTLTELVDDTATSVGGRDSDGLVTHIKTVNLPNVISTGRRAFYKATIESVIMPNLESMGQSCFCYCKSLASVYIPKVKNISQSGFQGAESLKYINVPLVTSMTQSAFENCYKLEVVDAASLSIIGTSSFKNCYSLKALIIRNTETICPLNYTTVFNYCYHLLGTTNATYNPNGDKDGYIYVPRALIEDYKVATNWVTLADQFRAVEDYTVDGTVTGEMDWAKMGVTIE